MDEAIEAINLTDDEAIAVKEDRYRFFFFAPGTWMFSLTTLTYQNIINVNQLYIRYGIILPENNDCGNQIGINISLSVYNLLTF